MERSTEEEVRFNTFLDSIEHTTDPGTRMELISANHALIRDFADLQTVLAKISKGNPRPSQAVTYVAQRMQQPEIEKDLRRGEEQFYLINRCAELIENVDQLKEIISVMKYFPDFALSIAQTHSSKIDSAEKLIELLNIMPSDAKNPLAEANKSLIKDGWDLSSVISSIPRARYDFAIDQQDKIKDAFQLSSILRRISNESETTDLAERQHTKIGNGEELAAVAERLEKSAVPFVVKHVDKIQDSGELVIVLDMLKRAYSLRNHYPVIQAYLTTKEISNSDDFLALLNKHVPETEVYSFVKACIKNIRNPSQVEEILRHEKFKHLSEYQKISLYIHLNLGLKIYFNDPRTQEDIALKQMNPNVFLFAAALDPEHETDFEFFLTHPICSVFALNERAQDLEMAITTSNLSEEIKSSRIAKIKAQQELMRMHNASRYIGINLSSIKPTNLVFNGALPEVSENTWHVEGVEDEQISHFRQLTAWLMAQDMLGPHHKHFAALENNKAIRDKSLFKFVVSELDTFVTVVAQYLHELKTPDSEEEAARQAHTLVNHLDACDQLGVCGPGVRSALQSMTRSLNPSAALMNVIDIELDRAIAATIVASGIKQTMEVHLPKDQALSLLGLNMPFSYDSYRLPLSDFNVQALSSQAAGQLIPERLWRESQPILETSSLLKTSTPEAVLWDADLSSALQRDWFSLHAAGLLPELTEAMHAEYLAAIKDLYPADDPATADDVTELKLKYLQVLSYISVGATNAELCALIENYNSGKEVKLTLSLKPEEEFANDYRRLLEEKGVLTLSAEQSKQLQAMIWQLLIKEGDWSTAENQLWGKLLSAPNGLAWIKTTIEASPPEDRSKIKLSSLLRCPTDTSLNLFRSLAADPFSAGWMMGWEIKIKTAADGRKSVNFIPLPDQPLSAVLSSLGLEENAHQMHIELEQISAREGGLYFWLAYMQSDAAFEATFSCIMGYLLAQGMYKFDNLLAVMDKMLNSSSNLEKTTALSFLEERCKQQRELKLWDCYWKTACFIPNFKFELNDREMVSSLKDRSNLRAALYLAGSMQNLSIALVKAGGEGLLTEADFKQISNELRELSTPSPAVDSPSAASVEDTGSTTTPSSGVEESKSPEDETAVRIFRR